MKKHFLFIVMAFLLALTFATLSRAADVTLTWDEVNGCSYEVYYGPASRQYDHKEVVPGTSCKLSLTPGIYYFAVTARLVDCKHTLCTSEYSDEVSLLLSDKPEIATIALSVE